MAVRIRTVRDLSEFGAAMAAIGHYFGWAPTEDDGRRFSRAAVPSAIFNPRAGFLVSISSLTAQLKSVDSLFIYSFTFATLIGAIP